MPQDFVHLHVHSDYSLLDGASSIKQLVTTAKNLGQTALALTDHGNMFAALRFFRECKAQGIKPVIGCEVYVANGSRFGKPENTNTGVRKYFHLILLAETETGYRNLMVLCSKGYTEGMYYKPRIDEELLTQYSEGLICLSACLAGELPSLLLQGKKAEAEAHVRRYRSIFGIDNYFIELQKHCTEIRIPLPVSKEIEYAAAPLREKHRIASENEAKNEIVRQLLARHTDDQILIIGQYITQLKKIAEAVHAPLITGKTPNAEREVLYDSFRAGDISVLVVSKVANFAIDLPDASVAIQISGTFGSRQEEAQRLGRILRPKERDSFFYTLVTRHSVEEECADHRQKFLAEQGYAYSLITDADFAADTRIR